MLLLFCIFSYQYTRKKEFGADWMMIFYHDSVSGGFFSSLEEAMFSENPNKYSIFSKIGDEYKIDGYYEFLLEYPTFDGYNRWKQSDLPWKNEEISGKSANGYTPINISWNSYNWGGLVKSRNSNHPGITLLDGSAGSDYWFYAIGCVDPYTYNPNYPGPFYSAIRYSRLWIRIQNSSPTKGIIGNPHFLGVFLIRYGFLIMFFLV